jgi:DNA-binding GntR family transcriptional regulator
MMERSIPQPFEAPAPDEVNAGIVPHDSVYAQLRRMILYSELRPGEWLRQVDLAAQFGVSRTPIREAMRSLQQEGLIELVPNYGARVSRLSVEEFEELYALRIGVEGLAARLGTQQASPEDIAALTRSYQRVAQLSASADVQRYLQEEWRFRLQLYRVTRRDRLLARIIDFREHAERYLRLAYNRKGRVAESLTFHQHLLAAVQAGDGMLAEQINQDALRWTLRHVTPILPALMDDDPPISP